MWCSCTWYFILSSAPPAAPHAALGKYAKITFDDFNWRNVCFNVFGSKIIKSSSRNFMTSNSRKMHFHCNSDCIALSKKWIIVFCPFLDSFCCEGIEQWINKFVLAYLSFHPTVMKNNCTKACRLSIPVLCFEIWPLLLLLHAIIPQPSLALAGRITMQLDAMRWHLMYALLLHNSASASGRMISRVSFP